MRGWKQYNGKGKRDIGGGNGAGAPIKPGECVSHGVTVPAGKESPVSRRKQLTVLTLTFALAFALYLNWNYSSSGGRLSITDMIMQTSAETTEEKNYGDAKYVSAQSDYFAEVRLQRIRTRDEALEKLDAVLSGSNLSDAEKDEAKEELAQITSYSAKESAAEGLIKAKGFSDCVVFISDGGVKVVVASAGLSDAEVAQISEIVIQETDLPAAAVNIVEIN